ncbi:hypothetical protein RB653_011180 (mitochondrion) [Dictyostelium firmibasis]|uniref:ATP synthase YMF19-like N-terminal domain-containing protein n=1 Tax=Dictyostelium firmibasis TaxID=79012 RepID=A0AAN7YKA2_9MYCE
MPQLDFLIFFNEMFYTLVAFMVFYTILYRSIIVKLAYNLKLRYKLSMKMKKAQINGLPNALTITKEAFTSLEGITKYIKYLEFRDSKLISTIIVELKNYFKEGMKNKKNS